MNKFNFGSELPDDFWGEDVKAAVAKFEKMLKENETYYFDYDVYRNIIDFYFTQRDVNKATKAIEYALQQFPNNTSVLVKKAQVLMLKDKNKEALNLLNEIEDFSKNDLEYLITKAGIHTQLGLHKIAISCYKTAIQLPNAPVEIHLFIALEYLSIQDTKTALSHLQKVTNEQPDNVMALEELVACHRTLDQPQKAIVDLKSIINNHPYSIHAWFCLATFQIEMEDTENAIESFDFCISIDPNCVPAYMGKASIHREQEKYEQAIAIAKEALEVEDENIAMVHIFIAECYEDIDNPQEAILHATQSTELSPDLEAAWAVLASALYNNKQYKQALKAVKRALKIDPNYTNALIILADIQADLQKHEEAIATYQRIFELEPNNTTIWIDYAFLLEKINMIEEAIETLRLASIMYEEISDYQYYMAYFYMQIDKPRKAVNHFKKGIAINPEKSIEIVEEFDILLTNPTIKKLMTPKL